MNFDLSFSAYPSILYRIEQVKDKEGKFDWIHCADLADA